MRYITSKRQIVDIDEYIRTKGVTKLAPNNSVNIRNLKKTAQKRLREKKRTEKQRLPEFEDIWFDDFNPGGLRTKEQMYKIYKGFKCWGTERSFMKQCRGVGLEGYVRNMPLYNAWFPDFVWPENKIIVEIDGPTHRRSKAARRERFKDEFLESEGWIVFRLKVPFNKIQARELAMKVKGMLKD